MHQTAFIVNVRLTGSAEVIVISEGIPTVNTGTGFSFTTAILVDAVAVSPSLTSAANVFDFFMMDSALKNDVFYVIPVGGVPTVQ